MKPSFFRIALLSILFVIPALAHAGEDAYGTGVRTARPNAAYFELFGRGLPFSFSYDRALDGGWIAPGLALSHLSIQNGTHVMEAVPYVNFYYLNQIGAPFFTLGLNLPAERSKMEYQQSTMGNIRFNSAGIATHVGLGWEYRSTEGYLFRAGSYIMFGHNVLPWFGFGVGYAF